MQRALLTLGFLALSLPADAEQLVSQVSSDEVAITSSFAPT